MFMSEQRPEETFYLNEDQLLWFFESSEFVTNSSEDCHGVQKTKKKCQHTSRHASPSKASWLCRKWEDALKSQEIRMAVLVNTAQR